MALLGLSLGCFCSSRGWRGLDGLSGAVCEDFSSSLSLFRSFALCASSGFALSLSLTYSGIGSPSPNSTIGFGLGASDLDTFISGGSLPLNSSTVKVERFKF